DGRTLASGGDDLNNSGNRVRLWDVGTGREVGSLSGHRSVVHTVAFSPDGRLLLSGSIDCTALIWNVADQTRRTLPAPLSDADRPGLWGALAGDARAAPGAVYELIAAGPDSVADLERRLQPVPAEAPPIDNLLADLGSERFAAREEATKAL